MPVSLPEPVTKAVFPASESVLADITRKLAKKAIKAKDPILSSELGLVRSHVYICDGVGYMELFVLILYILNRCYYKSTSYRKPGKKIVLSTRAPPLVDYEYHGQGCRRPESCD
jgi:hypothetical protein